MRHPHPHRPPFHPSQRGSVLIVVLIVIVMLALGAYTFSQFMGAEMQATRMYGREAQTRAWAESAIEFAAVNVTQRTLDEDPLYHNPNLFANVLMQDSGSDRGRGRFTLIAPAENDPAYRGVRFGLMDESGKLNLNAIPALKLAEADARGLLKNLPGMTEDIADAILDWIDTDSTPREHGAESDYYQGLSPPYAAKNGPLESLDDLLKIKGVTATELYGEDANRNGLLDPNENDADMSQPFDNADGALNPGWSAFLTVHSRERNIRADGSERIDVNQALLTELYDELQPEFGDDGATFIVAYRMNGPLASATGTASTAVATSGNQTANQVVQKLASSVASVVSGSKAGGVTRGGMDLSAGGTQKINSLYNLVDCQVSATVNNAKTTLQSPWSSSGGNVVKSLSPLFDSLTTAPAKYIEGRININQARYEVLQGIPNLPADVAEKIAKAHTFDPNGMPDASQQAQRTNTSWLLAEGITDVATLQQVDRFMTTRGDVFRVQAIGHFDRGGPVTRLEAVIDATQQPPAIVFRRDLSHLGAGFPIGKLFAPATSQTPSKGGR